MTNSIKLLPLPEGYDKYSPPRLYDGQMFHEGQMRAYARANAAAELRRLHAQAAQDEALLREALYALEYANDMTKPEDLQGCGCPICTNIAALRERLEGKTCTD